MGQLNRPPRLTFHRTWGVFALLAAGAAAGGAAASVLPRPAALAGAGIALVAAAVSLGLRAAAGRRRQRTGQAGARGEETVVGGRHAEADEVNVAGGEDQAANGKSAAVSEEPLTVDGRPLTAELRLALDVQRKWQPPVDLKHGIFRVTARSRQALDVGGDLFDAVVLDDTTAAVLVGDTPGKGLQAAFMVPALLLLFRSEVKRGGGPAKLLERMNRVLAGLDAGSQPAVGVTLGIGLLDAAAGEMRYAGAGHPAPYLVRPGASPRQLDSSSLPLGMSTEETYRETVIRFAPGERFVLYTDGIIENAGPDGDMYGFERFEGDLAAWPANEPAADWMERLLDRQEGSHAHRRDDRTLLVVEHAGASPGRETLLRERFWRIRSVPGCERVLVTEITALLQEDWADAGRIDDIITCVAEAVMNAAEHGNGYDESRTIAVQVHFGNAILVVRVRDEGAGFDPEPYRNKRADPTAHKHEHDGREDGRGWGLLLIDGLTDYWVAMRDENGFCVEMYFLAGYRRGT